MKYIRRYETNNEFENDYYGDTYAEPWVSYTMENEKIKYNKRSSKNFNFQPLGEYTTKDFGVTEDIIEDWINIISKPDFQVESLSNVMVMSEPIIGAYYTNNDDYSERIEFSGSNYFATIYIDDGMVYVGEVADIK